MQKSRKHEEFQVVHEDDLATLEDFRKELGLGSSRILAEGASIASCILSPTASPVQSCNDSSTGTFLTYNIEEEDCAWLALGLRFMHIQKVNRSCSSHILCHFHVSNVFEVL